MSNRQRPAPCGSRHAVPGRRGPGTVSSRVRTTVPQRFGLGRERGGWAQPVGTQPETLGDHRGVAGVGPGAGQHLAVAPGLDRVRADRNQRVAMLEQRVDQASVRTLDLDIRRIGRHLAEAAQQAGRAQNARRGSQRPVDTDLEQRLRQRQRDAAQPLSRSWPRTSRLRLAQTVDRRPAGLAARPFAESNPAGGARYIFTAIATIRTQIFHSSPRAIVVAHNRIVPEMQDQVSLLTTVLVTSKSPFMAAGTDSRAGA